MVHGSPHIANTLSQKPITTIILPAIYIKALFYNLKA
jgi:hypothetical protein